MSIQTQPAEVTVGTLAHNGRELRWHPIKLCWAVQPPREKTWTEADTPAEAMMQAGWTWPEDVHESDLPRIMETARPRA